jgi:hypothetical protein
MRRACAREEPPSFRQAHALQIPGPSLKRQNRLRTSSFRFLA